MFSAMKSGRLRKRMAPALARMKPQMMPQGGLTLANVPQRLTLGSTPQPVEDTVGVNAEAGIPLWMRLGLPRPAEPSTPPMPQADTGFNINNAMNTFNQQLGQRVASGQMTMDQARAAQAEMTALQRMPNATREQATDVAQRQMQVGQYAPVARPDIVVQPQRIMPAPLSSTPPAPMPKMVQPPMPQADTGFNINNAVNTFNQSLGERVASGQMTLDQARAAQAEMTALQRTANPTREQATNVAQSQLQVGPYAPQPGMPRIGYRYPPQPVPMPRQPSGVDNSTFMAGDPNFRFGQTPQQMAPNAQGMAMGGLMRKYGGMC